MTLGQPTRTYRRVPRGTIAAVHPGRVQGPVSVTPVCACVCVCALYTGHGGMCRTYTDAPPITLTCKYVICSSDSRYTWLHSVTSTDVESLHPTGSLLLEGEALSSSTYTSPVVTHTHASRVASHHVASRSEGGTTETNHRRCGRHPARRDGFGMTEKKKNEPAIQLFNSFVILFALLSRTFLRDRSLNRLRFDSESIWQSYACIFKPDSANCNYKLAPFKRDDLIIVCVTHVFMELAFYRASRLRLTLWSLQIHSRRSDCEKSIVSSQVRSLSTPRTVADIFLLREDWSREKESASKTRRRKKLWKVSMRNAVNLAISEVWLALRLQSVDAQATCVSKRTIWKAYYHFAVASRVIKRNFQG